jgi:membrane protease YdiL (CAAX protease family)
MFNNSSSTNLALELSAFGLALVIAGVWWVRRRQEGDTTGLREEERDGETEIEVDARDDEPTLAGDLPDDGNTIRNTPSSAPQKNLLLNYFSLVFLLAVPFWLFGGRKLPLPFNLPVAALGTFVPVTAAAILTFRQSGFAGVQWLFKKALDAKKIKNKIWYLPALFLMPLIYFLSYAVMWLVGLPLPDPVKVPLQLVPMFFVMFFIGDAGEELGWTGYAIDPMQNRWGALKASFLLGVIWAAWHAIPFIQTHNPPNWIVWQTLSVIPLRILIVWIYNSSGKSVFAATLLHVMTNVSWSLFPNFGSHYNPFVTGLITWLASGTAILGWKAKTSAGSRYASVSQG